MSRSTTTRSRPVVATIFGTRPQFIKLAVLWQGLEQQFRSILIDSGQHYDWEMAGVFHDETGLRRPDVHLGVGSAPAASQIGRIADALDARLSRLRPDAVIVIGDTSTTAGGAIAAAYRNIPLAHVEAGLRSFDIAAPEEKNRTIADHLARWRLCPTQSAMANLRREGIRDGVLGVGDLMYEHFLREHNHLSVALDRLLPKSVGRGDYYFVTAHRAENVDESAQLRKLVAILVELDRDVIYPVHPRTARNLKKQSLWRGLKGARHVHLLAPRSYYESLALMGGARAVLTDSGGVQREAYWSRVPCLILRDVTEWPELLAVRAGILTGLNPGRVARALRRLPRGRTVHDPVFAHHHPSRRIVDAIACDLCGRP
jgi:UDP-N-acetylglucosamine 2-epimerase